MTRLEAAAADYLRFRELHAQLAHLTDNQLAEKFECSDSSIRKIAAGRTISTLTDDDHRLILDLIAERKAIREEIKGKNLQDSCARHHVGKTTLINHLISIGEREEAA